MLRQPMRTSITGTSQPTLPTEPDTTVRATSMAPPGQLPPDGGRGDDGQADQEQPDAVTALLGLEVAGRAADLAGTGADAVGDGHPGRGDAAAERAEAARDRARAVADGARGRTARPGMDFVGFFVFVEVRLVGLRVLRDRELELPREVPEDRDEDVLLLRDPGGEDVRVAMVEG